MIIATRTVVDLDGVGKRFTKLRELSGRIRIKIYLDRTIVYMHVCMGQNLLNYVLKICVFYYVYMITRRITFFQHIWFIRNYLRKQKNIPFEECINY